MKFNWQRGIILISALIMTLTVSCGIPTIANFDPGITYSSSAHSYTFNSESSSNSIPYGLEHLTSDTLTSTSSPSILLMYNISEANFAYTSTMRSRFNSLYRKSSSSYFGLPVTFTTSDYRLCDYTATNSTTSNSFSIGLYPLALALTEDTATYPTAPDYTTVDGMLKDILQAGTTRVYLKFPDSLQSGSPLTFGLYSSTDDSAEPLASFELYRYNGDVFRTFSGLQNVDDATYRDEYAEYYDWSSQYDSRSDVSTASTYLNIFVAVNVTKGSAADFSNMYWSELQLIESIPIN